MKNLLRSFNNIKIVGWNIDSSAYKRSTDPKHVDELVFCFMGIAI